MIALLASQADGETVVRGAAELKLKESDRIKSSVSLVSKTGGNAEVLDDGFVIRGKTEFLVSHGCLELVTVFRW